MKLDRKLTWITLSTIILLLVVSVPGQQEVSAEFTTAQARVDLTGLKVAVYEGTPEKVEFIVSKDVKKYFINRDWHTSQKIILNDDGTLLIEMFVPIVPDFISWIFSWSDEIIVKSPKKLIGQIKYQCKKMTEQYNNLDEGM